MGTNQTSPIRQPQRFSIPQRRPLKQSVYPSVKPPPKRKPKPMTVCIAAIYLDPVLMKQGIVFCSDRMTQGWHTAENLSKQRRIGNKMMALLSGDVARATELADICVKDPRGREHGRCAEATRAGTARANTNEAVKAPPAGPRCTDGRGGGNRCAPVGRCHD